MPPPRRSATLLLLRDDPFEVLMVHRSSSGTFASALVFPGGALDEADRSEDWAPLVEDYDEFDGDERALRLCAIRETWEETSVVVGASDEAPAAGILGGQTFRDFVAGSGVRLRLGALETLAHWVTPVVEPRRFDTRFFIARAPHGQVAVADGNETVGVEWVEPAAAVAAARRGEWPIIFPTLMNLDRLAESSSVESALAAANARPRFTVEPIMEIADDGSRVVTIAAEAGYSVTRFVAAGRP
jgi:8-oxo-dGTP pyrophosphatase MutT (NUDIX family)